MALRIAINGFGRIGRMVCRRALEVPDLEVVAVNASYPAETLAHLLKYDTVHGRYHLPVAAESGGLRVGEHRICVVGDRTPAKLPWAALNIDLVIEATGKFRSRKACEGHLEAGARWVLISAPAKGGPVDATVVYGVNHRFLDPERHQVISGASCTTNALAPLVKVLDAEFNLISGLMTTVHSYTSDQRLLDNPHKDLYRARGAALAIIPSTTGAAETLAAVLPHLQGRLNGFALRVPTPDVSVVDLTARFMRPVSIQSVNAALQAAAADSMHGIIGISDEPLVSSDFLGDSRSTIVDVANTLVGPDHLVKILAWYDNEWGYSCRLVDMATYLAKVPTATAVAD